MQSRILVADDAEVNREILRDMLEDDYIIEMAEDGEQVIRKLEMYQNDTEALLLDLHMPKMSGYNVIAEMKRRGWMDKIPVLIISGEGTAEVERQCFELGVLEIGRAHV